MREEIQKSTELNSRMNNETDDSIVVFWQNPQTCDSWTACFDNCSRSFSCGNYALNIQCDHLGQTCYCTNWEEITDEQIFLFTEQLISLKTEHCTRKTWNTYNSQWWTRSPTEASFNIILVNLLGCFRTQCHWWGSRLWSLSSWNWSKWVVNLSP